MDLIKKEIIIKTIRSLNQIKNNYLFIRNFNNDVIFNCKDLDILVDDTKIDELVDIISSELKPICFFTKIKKGYKKYIIYCVYQFDEIVGNYNVFKIEFQRFVTIKVNKFEDNISGLGIKLVSSQITSTCVLLSDGLKINIPDEKFELILLINHYKNKRKNDYLSRIIEIINSNKVLKNFLDFYHNEDELIKKLNFILRYFMNELNLNKRGFSYLKGICMNLFSYRKNRNLFIQKPISIYFSGPDGSGKSTTCIWTVELLKKINVKVKAIRTLQILTIFSFGILNMIRKRKFINIKSELTNVGRLGTSFKKRDRNTGKRSWIRRRKIGLVFGLLDICVFGRLYIWLCKLRGYYCIIETSPYDIFVKRHRPEFPFIEKTFVNIIPKSDKHFLCKADPFIIIERKPELKIEELTDYYDRIGRIFSKTVIGVKLDTIPTDKGFGVTCRSIIRGFNSELGIR